MAKNVNKCPAYENVVLAPNELAFLETRHRVEQPSDSTVHFHEFIELIYFKKVKGHVIFNENVLELQNHSMLYIPSNVPHAFKIEGLMELHLYQCSPQLLLDQGFNEGEYFTQEPCYFSPEKNYWDRINVLFDWYFENIKQEEKSLQQHILKMITWCFWDILNNHMSLNQAPLNNSDHHFFEPFILSLDNNLRLSLDEAASMCYVTRSHFSRKFKKYFGMSFSNYIEKRKIQKAQSLILHTSLSMTEIAHRSGFSESSYFSSTFKKHTSMTPLEMRKGVINQ